MQSKFLSTKLFRAIVIIAAFGLLVFLNPYRILNPVRSIIFNITRPLLGSIRFMSFKLSEYRDFIISIGELKRDNEQLFKKNQELLAENARLKDVKNENNLLREQLGIIPKNKYNLESAIIIGQDFIGSENWVMIDKGDKDSIKKDMPVIVSNGILVGKIKEVFPRTSKVSLITNPRSSINAVVSETDAQGIVKGVFGLGLMFDMVLQTDVIKAGDEVITSGIGGNMPRGLLIGKIQNIQISNDGLFQKASVFPYAKFSKLRLVFVIKD
ncbi:MAG: rod shape-determining protein MreC [Candidatus Doudnabacteria bacterium RIFCSPHIGHO2_02_FULL_43_13b]|nr:MAG: rod shape-determining protein MreC [Candidatus Doudnabacteria bacterium RIFCSPHIGHO2_02_FULL_43_13b]